MKKVLLVVVLILGFLTVSTNTEAALREVKSSSSMEWAVDDSTIKWRGDDWFTAEIHTLIDGSSVAVDYYTFEYLPEYKDWYYNIKGNRIYSLAKADGMEKTIDIANEMKK
jgi:hypothetical protein